MGYLQFFGPEAYLMHLTDRCQFLNCSVRMGGGDVDGFVMNSEGIPGMREGGRGAL